MNVKRSMIIILAAVLLLITAASILYFNLVKRNIRSVEEYAASIESLIFSGDYSGAAANCSEGLRHYPESAELYILKSRAYLLSGDIGKALGTLDYGYKQTQSETILEHREQLSEVFVDNTEFLPLTEPENPSEAPDSSTSPVTSGDSENRVTETYRPDTPIKVNIPNVSPPPPPPAPSVPNENTEGSTPETSIGSGENKTN